MKRRLEDELLEDFSKLSKKQRKDEDKDESINELMLQLNKTTIKEKSSEEEYLHLLDIGLELEYIIEENKPVNEPLLKELNSLFKKYQVWFSQIITRDTRHLRFLVNIDKLFDEFIDAYKNKNKLFDYSQKAHNIIVNIYKEIERLENHEI